MKMINHDFYIVYDGRANFDEDKACVLDCIGETTEEAAIKEFEESWNGHDAVLFCYEDNGEELVNGKLIKSA